MQETPIAGDYVSIASVNGVGALELDLLDANQDVIATADTTGGVAEISLYGNSKILAGSTYYVRVEGYNGGTSPLYTLQIDAAGGDRFEPDNSPQAAHNLNDPAPDPNDPTIMSATAGYVHGLETWDDLAIEPEQASTTVSGSNPSSTDDEWYSFTLKSEGLAGDYARIDYDRSLGDLVLGLYTYDSQTNVLTFITMASTAQDFEQISLQAARGGDLLLGGQRLRWRKQSGGNESRLHAHAQYPRGAGPGRLRDGQHTRDRRQPRDHPGANRRLSTNHCRSPPATRTGTSSRRKTRVTPAITFRSATTRRRGRWFSSSTTRAAIRSRARWSTVSATPRRSA